MGVNTKLTFTATHLNLKKLLFLAYKYVTFFFILKYIRYAMIVQYFLLQLKRTFLTIVELCLIIILDSKAKNFTIKEILA